MLIKLNRNQLFLIGIGIIFFFLFLNRIVFVVNGKFTQGFVDGGRSWSKHSLRYSGTYSAPRIKFQTKDYVISFYGETNSDLQYGDTVKVVYEIAKPTNAKVYSFVGFWLTPFIWSAAIVVLLMSAVYSFISKNDIFKIEIGRKIRLKKEQIIKVDSDRFSIEE